MIASEVARVREHLRGAEALARAGSLDGLDGAQLLTRALLLDELARYREAGVFPKNHDSRSPRPTFVDEHGTRCAMAHLMELGGAGELVAEVARENNHAYVEELARDDRVLAWLRAAGLTVEEAARIQPEYTVCYRAPSRCLCAGAYGEYDAAAEPVIVPDDAILYEATVVAMTNTGGLVRIEVVHHGDASRVGAQRDVAASLTLVPGHRVLVAAGSTFRADVAIASISGDALSSTCLLPRSTADDTYFPLPAITKADALDVAALSMTSCRAALEARDPAWAESRCERTPRRPSPSSQPTTSEPSQVAPTSPPPDGCSVSLASSSAESVSVLLAVLSALAVRRSVRPR